MTIDQQAARDQMIATMRTTFGLTDTTAARLVDIGLAAEAAGQRAWPAIGRAIREAVDRGEAWAMDAQWPDVANLG